MIYIHNVILLSHKKGSLAIYYTHGPWGYYTKGNKFDKSGWKWKSLSHAWLFATQWTIQSTESSRPEYWSG